MRVSPLTTMPPKQKRVSLESSDVQYRMMKTKTLTISNFWLNLNRPMIPIIIPIQGICL